MLESTKVDGMMWRLTLEDVGSIMEKISGWFAVVCRQRRLGFEFV